MSAWDVLLDDLRSQELKLFEDNQLLTLNGTFTAAENYLNKIGKVIEIYEQTNEFLDLNFDIWEEIEDLDQLVVEARKKTPLNFINKENIRPNDNESEETSSLKNRPRRNAFKEAAQSLCSSTTKTRKGQSSASESTNTVTVKTEKQSICGLEEDIESLKVAVKTENEEMPAPQRPAPKKKRQKKTTTSKIQVKQEPITEELSPCEQLDTSDVILIENKNVPTITLDSDDNEKTLKKEEEVKTSKRTKKKKAEKRARTPSFGETKNNEKRSKSDSQPNVDGNITSETNYEDAVSQIEDNKECNNATFVTSASVKNTAAPEIMNTTVVVQNPKCIHPVTADDLMTDDESEDEKKKKAIPQTITKTITKPSKQVFSPFEPSPVKKKVQAFERLREESNAIPVRITRTKTKAQAKEAEEESHKEVEIKNSVKEKAKMFTPQASKFIPTASSTTQKVNRLVTTPSGSSNESVSSKLASALKASQVEYKEREKRRKEKEEEALRKREALLQAQIEERKRKREEKQLKAQQQREALEKEKMKSLEVQRLKDERHRQLMAEQEEKKQKQKEELEKKRLMAKMRAIEEKKKEEERKLEEQKKTDELAAKLAKQDEVMARLVQKQKMEREKQKKVPIYMTTRAPLLPTPDCYDSDDEENMPHRIPPTWDQKANLMELEIIQLAATEAVKNSFFSRKAQTPDLVDIFEVIEAQKLKRSSSALWQKPPRFTMLQNVNEQDENFTDSDND